MRATGRPQQLEAFIHLCICQALVEPLRRLLYQTPIKYFLASTIVSRFGNYMRWMPRSLDGLSFSLYSTFCLCVSSNGFVFPLLRRTEVSTLWSSFFLNFMCFANCILGNLSFWANIHLSVSTNHVCSFGIGLPHLGWYLADPSICLRISWIHCY